MKKNNYKNWNENFAKTWKRYPSPARPSKEELGIFKKFLNFYYFEKSNLLKVLILGSTPEFRDLCNKNYLEVYCMDINKRTYEALGLLVKQKNNKEKLINSNWLDFSVPFRFDIIIGDNVTGMFSITKYPQFFKKMSKHLEKGGLLILRSMVQNPGFDITPEQSISNYRKKYKKKRINIFTATHNNFALYFLNRNNSEYSMLDLR